VRGAAETDMEADLPPDAPSPRHWRTAEHGAIHKHPVDFCVVLGGDGTLIRAAYAFPQGCPPVLAFALGSLGFLTPFPVTSVPDSLGLLLNGHFGVKLRARLEFELHRPAQQQEQQVLNVAVLNEAVIDRGAGSSLVGGAPPPPAALEAG
jgi:NAD+ kinase